MVLFGEYPPWVPADDMRNAALRFVDALELRNAQPDYTPLGTLFTFGAGGHAFVVPGPSGGERDEMQSLALAKLARRLGLTPMTADWSQLVSAILGHIAIWEGTELTAAKRSGSIPRELLVLDPQVLNAKRKTLFGGHGGSRLRSPSADEMRQLISELPVVDLAALERGGSYSSFLEEPLVTNWIRRWRISCLSRGLSDISENAFQNMGCGCGACSDCQRQDPPPPYTPYDPERVGNDRTCGQSTRTDKF